LCIHQGSMRLHLIKELHEEALGWHSNMDKNKMLAKERYFWPYINKDVKMLVKWFIVFQIEIGRSQNTGLYTPFLVLERPSEAMSMEFVLELTMKQRKDDSMMTTPDQFSKMPNFIAWKRTCDATKVATLFFKGAVRHHCLPRTITS